MKRQFERIRFGWWHIKYELWPPVKVRGRFYWWVIRYGGKKRIPREVVFGAMAKSLQRMNDNLEKAYQIGAHDPNTSAEEVHKVLAVRKKAHELTTNIEKLK